MNKLPLALFAFVSVSLASYASGAEETTDIDCTKPLFIKTVEAQELLDSYLHIKKCAVGPDKLDVFVKGSGGGISDAQTFFDHMRTSGFSSKVRFIAFGRIASASNIVWLAADERVVTPGSLFLLHEFAVNNHTEDPELRVTTQNLHVANTTRAVRLAAGDAAAKLWQNIVDDKRNGVMFDGVEALKNGWATKMLPYK